MQLAKYVPGVGNERSDRREKKTSELMFAFCSTLLKHGIDAVKKQKMVSFVFQNLFPTPQNNANYDLSFLFCTDNTEKLLVMLS